MLRYCKAVTTNCCVKPVKVNCVHYANLRNQQKNNNKQRNDHTTTTTGVSLQRTKPPYTVFPYIILTLFRALLPTPDYYTHSSIFIYSCCPARANNNKSQQKARKTVHTRGHRGGHTTPGHQHPAHKSNNTTRLCYHYS